MAPVGPRYRPHWHAMRQSKLNDKLWTSAACRRHCLIVKHYIGTNPKNNGVIKQVLNNEGILNKGEWWKCPTDAK